MMQGSRALTAHLEDAYKIAYHVLGGAGEQAWAVLTEAYDGALAFRSRYLENLHPFPPRPRKHRFSEGEAFQYVLYLELEAAEKEVEALGGLGPELFILRYIKCILLKTLAAPPFRMTVAISGLLYNFRWAEISLLYAAIAQGEERGVNWSQNDKNDVLRALKKALRERFGDRLHTHQDGNDSLKFEVCPDSSRFFDCVQNSLALLVLWGQEAVGRELLTTLAEAVERSAMNKSLPPMPQLAIPVPADADPSRHTGGEKETMDAWRARKYALMNPQIFSKIAELLKLPKLESKLQIPAFAFETPDDENGDPPTMFADVKARPEMYQELFEDQGQRRRRRRLLDTRSFRILVDGVPQEQPLDAGTPLSLRIPSDADTISIIADDDEGPICVGKLYFALYRDEIETSESTSLGCERSGAPAITLDVAPEGADAGWYDVTIRLKQRPFWGRIYRLTLMPARFARRSPALATVTLFLIFAIAVAMWFILPRKRTLQADVAPPASPIEQPSADLLEERRYANRPTTPTAGVVAQLFDNGQVIDLKQPADIGAYGRVASADAVRDLLDHGAGYPTQQDLSFVKIKPMGNSSEGSTFSGCPNGAVVRTARPIFRWDLPALSAYSPGEYEVHVFNAKTFETVASSGLVHVRAWRPSRPLPRGVKYSWEVVVDPRGKAFKLPQKGIVMFRVLDRSTDEALKQAEAIQPVSRLVLADLYARAGLFKESEEQLQILMRENPDSRDLRELAARVMSRMRGSCR